MEPIKAIAASLRDFVTEMQITAFLNREIHFAMAWVWAVRWFRRTIYGLSALVSIWIIYYGLAIFNVFGLNTVEEGWRIGNLSDYGMSNRMLAGWMPTGWVFPTGEGWMLLGDASSRNATLDGEQISPSHFSTSTTVRNKYLATMLSQPVAMHYRQLYRAVFLGGETNIRVDSFEKQVPVTMPADCSEKHGWLTKRVSTMGGKIVEVADNGHPLLWKTYEVILYPGGNEFKKMSITDTRIYECAIMAAKSGMTMLLTYDETLIRDPVTQKTYYNLVGIANQ